MFPRRAAALLTALLLSLALPGQGSGHDRLDAGVGPRARAERRGAR